MKVCHVITRMILGGAQENTILTCEGLRARGCEVTLVTGPALGPEGDLMNRARSGGYEVFLIDDMRREISPLRDLRAYHRIAELLKRIRPDIVHSHSSKAGILTRRGAAKIGGMKIVHTVHGLPFHPYEEWWRNRLYISLERRSARRTDAIISVSDAMTAQALAARVGTPDQYTTIYSGMMVRSFANRPPLSDKLRSKMNLPPHGLLVTQVSRLAELKGHNFIIEAASRIRDPKVHFCFVGDGRLRERIESEIAQRGLVERFHLTGLLPLEQIPAVMHASDIVVHCSLREGLPRAIPQAMLASRPVICFDVDGARELVDTQTGILLPPEDVDGLVLAVESLKDAPELRYRLGSAGRARCVRLFDHNRMVDEILKVYDRVLQRGR